LEFLRQSNSGERIEIGKQVVVVGGGNTAIDAARVARRCGAEAAILYRRTRAEMPANAEEIAEAEEEDIQIVYLAAPTEIQAEEGRIASVLCQRMELGEPDESGRRRPVPVDGDTFTLPAQTLIVAVSQQPDWDGLEDLRTPLVWTQMDDKGYTERNGLYAGGDVEGIGIVAEALIQGRRAAEAMHAKFRSLEPPIEAEPEVIRSDRINLHVLETTERHEGPRRAASERLDDPWNEVEGTLSPEEVIAEARRCINCGESFVKPKKVQAIHVIRRITQIGLGTLLFNAYWGVLSTKMVYGGPLRKVCVPGLNCHSCPTALMGCPIGMLQHFSATHRIPWFLIGFLGIIGLLSGRFTCGWLCPWGLLQDLLHRFKKLMVHIPKVLIYFKYAVLVGVVIIIPYFTYEHWFSTLCPNGALIAGIPWVLWNPVDPEIGITVLDPADVGSLFTIKMIILGAFLLLFLFIKRPFCRTVCPLGAIYALFNRISLVSLKVKSSCSDCAQCSAICPTDLEVRREINSEGCIKCLECTQCEHVKFTWNWPWKKRDPKIPAGFSRALEEARTQSSAVACSGSCGHSAEAK
jgi:ferredoxin